MPSPSWDELADQIQEAIDVLEKHYAQQTIPADADDYFTTIKSDFALDQVNGLGAFRALAASALLDGGRGLIAPILTSYCHHQLTVPERNVLACLDRIYKDFATTPRHVKSRGVSFGSASFAGTGNGLVRRLTKDENDYDLENIHPEQKVLRCVSSANTGSIKHEEEFELRGSKASIDALQAGSSGSGIVVRGGQVKALSSRNSLAKNANFQSHTKAGSFSGGTYTLQSGDSITDWTVSSGAVTSLRLDQNANMYYEDTAGVDTPHGLVLLGDVTIEQSFEDAGIQVAADNPHWRQLAYRRRSSCDGTLSLVVGSKTISKDLSTAANDTWELLVPSLDKNLWPINFDQDAAKLQIGLSGRTTGDVVIAKVMFNPMWFLDGCWHAIIGGNTKFRLDDQFTWADTIASDSKIQKWLFWLFGRYLPHTAHATQITASGGRTLTFANSGSADTITASTGSFVSDGYKAGMVVTIAGSSSNNMTTGPLASVAATVLTFGSDTSLVNEGPLSATCTLNAAPRLSDP